MKRFLPIILALIFGIGIGSIAFRERSTDSHDDSSKSSAASEKWTCSMHPQIQAPKPGKCPICAMELIPLSEMGANGQGREYSMSESAKVLAGITTTPVERRYPEAEVRLFGSVKYDETLQKTIAARFPGRIDRLFVDYTGIPVKAGDHLATIYSPDLLSAQTELLTAKRFNNADALRISREKLRLWGFSEERIKKIESSGSTSDQLMIDATASGIVTQKEIQEGDYVQTGSPLFRISDLSELWIMFDAYESDKPWLRFGQSISFTAEATPGEIFEGRISFISPDLSHETHTFSVRVNFDNTEGLLKPGMFVRGIVHAKVAGAGRVIDPSLAGKWISPMHPEVVKDGPGKCDVCGMDLVPAEKLGYSVEKTSGKAPLVVPVTAVLNTGKRSLVYLAKTNSEEPTYEGREILLGPRAGDVYLVEAGLDEGDEVVSEGAFVIDSALQIHGRPSMMSPGDKSTPLFPRIELDQRSLSRMDEIVSGYFEIQLALAGDDFKKTGTATKRLLTLLGEVTLEENENAAAVFPPLKEKIESALKKITEADSIKKARIPFEPLSLSINELVLRFGTEKTSVFVAHCPMAFSNRGADWLQGNKDLLNPYFGDAMLHCGDIRKQIAGNPEDEAEHKHP